MILGDILQRVQTGYSHGVQASSSRLGNRFVYNIFTSVRARLLSQKSAKKQHISLWNYQVLPCIEFIKVPKHLCPCLPPAGCMIWRSKHPLPEVISDLNGPMIQFVSNATNDRRIDSIDPQQVKNLGGDKYTSAMMSYFILNDYIWVINTGEKYPLLMMAGIFQDPVEADDFPSRCPDVEDPCVEKDCRSRLEFDFNMSNSEIDALVALTVAELQQWFMQNPEDKHANSSDDSQPMRYSQSKQQSE
jgi:hypothetical protein